LIDERAMLRGGWLLRLLPVSLAQRRSGKCQKHHCDSRDSPL
jgi:hypothetical protein